MLYKEKSLLPRTDTGCPTGTLPALPNLTQMLSGSLWLIPEQDHLSSRKSLTRNIYYLDGLHSQLVMDS